MVYRQAVKAVAVVVAVSLVAAPFTMAAWGEQANFAVEQIDRSEIDGETAVIQFSDLSVDSQWALERAIDAPDNRYTVYGRESWPDRFRYSDTASTYTIQYDDQHYRLTTAATGGFSFAYWLFELPFIFYGLLLGFSLSLRESAARTVGLTIPGIGFHLLGPAFNFPIVGQAGFMGIGALAMFGAALVIVFENRYAKLGSDDERSA